MTDDPDARWRRLCGVAMDAFGWSAEQFWASTPHEFWAMVDARKEANKAYQQR